MMYPHEAWKIVAQSIHPSMPPLYRQLYGLTDGKLLEITSASGWTSLPFLTKADLTTRPLSERIFCSEADVDHIRSTSGTTGTPPLFCGRTPLRHMEYRYAYHDFKKPILAFGVPAMPHWHENEQRSHGDTPRVIVWDPKYPQASARLAKAAGADSMSLFAFHIPLAGEALKAFDANTAIRLIEICGESCTHALYRYMRETFPNATIIPFYGSSEVEDSPLGMPCRAITGEEPLSVYHAKPSQYHELVDPESGNSIPIEAGAEGELILTSYPGDPCALPLIRFRTGDMVRVVDATCPTHGTWSFTVLGRVSVDFLKILGGVLRADEIERVLRRLRINDTYEAHRRELSTPTGPKLELVLHLDVPEDSDKDLLARMIATELRVNPLRTYAQGVLDGLYAPLRCVPLVKRTSPKKAKRLFAD